MRARPNLRFAIAAFFMATTASAVAPTFAAGAFANLSGSWSGSGQMRLEGGRTEALRCKAYYTDKSGGSALGISLRCASSASKVELHASLIANGGRVSGDWEERQFNVAGRANGSASGNQISLSINGGGLTGSMSVTTSGSRQSVSISAENVALKGIQIALARD
jgi:hypothetical protein